MVVQGVGVEPLGVVEHPVDVADGDEQERLDAAEGLSVTERPGIGADDSDHALGGDHRVAGGAAKELRSSAAITPLASRDHRGCNRHTAARGDAPRRRHGM